MGGYNSGRRSGRATVEASLALDINRLLRQRLMQPGHVSGGMLTWHTTLGDVRGSILLRADMRETGSASARLIYKADGVPVDRFIDLEAQPMPFGGVRWWWTCPRSGRRAAKLFLSPQTGLFVHREAAGLAYQSWRDAPMQRGHNASRRLYRKLGVKYEGTCTPIPPRPKGMHATVYEQTCAAILDCEERIDDAFIAKWV